MYGDGRKILFCRTDLLQQSWLTKVFQWSKLVGFPYWLLFFLEMWWDKNWASGNMLVTQCLVWLLFTGAPVGVLSVGYCHSNLAVCFVFTVCSTISFRPPAVSGFLLPVSFCLYSISEKVKTLKLFFLEWEWRMWEWSDK